MGYIDEEYQREEIKRIAIMFIREGVSLRKFAENHKEDIGLSHVSIRERFQEDALGKISQELYKEVDAILKGNKPETVDDLLVKKRVISAVKYLLEDGLTIEEITEKLNSDPDYVGVTYWTVYRDITVRSSFIGLDDETKQKINDILKNNSRGSRK